MYRVRLTLKRYAQTGMSKAYAYRVNEIEVVPGTLGGKIAPATYPTDATSICGSILLRGVADVNGLGGGSKLEIGCMLTVILGKCVDLFAIIRANEDFPYNRLL